MGGKIALSVKNITKRFSGVAAVDRVDFDLKTGEIHALLGENGAGKSTLMHMISGLLPPDGGAIFVDNRKVSFGSPKDAIRSGIHMVHQEFMLIPVFSVAENIMLGEEVHWGPFLDMAEAERQVTKISNNYGLPVDPATIVENLPVGLQQRVEILKALYRKAKILILDEPTAVLTPQETGELFRVMRQLAKNGVSIIFITHKLKEVPQIADRITIMRNGSAVETTRPHLADAGALAALMIGRARRPPTKKSPVDTGEAMLEIRRLTVRRNRSVAAVNDISFRIHSGEIFGIAGVQGNGQSELAGALAGLVPIHTGTVKLSGKVMLPNNPRKMIEAGLAHIPEDRRKHGLVLSHSVADNQVLSTYYRTPFCRHYIRDDKTVQENSRRLIQRFDIRPRTPGTAARALSGGNQQKVIISRELNRNIRVLLANQPTRGLDAGSIETIHRQIVKMRNCGTAVLLISSDLDEVLALSDRIAVMYRGRIRLVPDQEPITPERLGLMMAGAFAEEIRCPRT